MPFKDKEAKRKYNKEYYKKWYAKPENRKKAIRNAAISKKIYAKRNYDYITEYKSQHPCMHCDENNPVCLSFHHKDGTNKEANISDMCHRCFSIKRIREEIDKCIVLCHNCHAMETWQ